MGKLPAFQFYPGDWIRDSISGCSLAAQGLWLRMLIVMHDAERRGYLSMNGSPIHPGSIAQRCGCTPEQYETLLDELSRASVPRRTSDGIIFSKRMVEDEKRRKKERAKKRNQRRNASCPHPVPQMSRPSSSSTSVSSSKKKDTTCVFSLPAWFPEDAWKEFLAHRKKLGAGVAKESYDRMVSKFERWKEAGWEPRSVLDKMVEKGWRSFSPEWVKDGDVGKDPPPRPPDPDLEERREMAKDPEYVHIPGGLSGILERIGTKGEE